MAMQFQYGSWMADPDSVSINAFRQSMVPAANGKPVLKKISWGLTGKIITHNSASPQQDVMNQIQAAAVAFSANYQDVGFPNTPFYIQNSGTFGGVVVTQPFSTMEARGAEGITYMRWTAAIEANYLFPEAIAGIILNFDEDVTYRSNDGLPIFVERLPVFGAPILQQVSTNSWYFANQRGSAEVMGEVNVDPQPALFPGLLRTSGNSAVNVSFKSPKMLRGKGISCVTTWNYEYISSVPFFSYPNIGR